MSKEAVLLMLLQEHLALKRGKKTPNGEWVFNKYFLGDRAHKPLPCCTRYYDYIEHEPRGLYEHFKSVEHIANAEGISPEDLQSTVDKIKTKRLRKKTTNLSWKSF